MKNKRIKRLLLLTIIIIIPMIMMFGCFKKPEVDKESSILTIEEAKTIAVGDEYEKVIVKTSGVVLEDGNVDEIVIEPSVGDGEVTLSNIQGRLLDVQGGGTNSIYLKGGSSFDKVEVKREEGPVRIHNDNTSKVNSLIIVEGSQDVILVGEVGDLSVLGKDITVTASGSTLGNVLIEGTNSTMIIEEDSQVEEVSISKGAEGSKIVINGKAKEVKAEASDSEIEIKGDVDILVVTGKSNIVVTGKVKEIQFMAGAEDSSIVVKDEGNVETIKTETKIQTAGDGTVEKLITNNKDNVTGDIKSGETLVKDDPFTEEEEEEEEKEEVVKTTPQKPSTSKPSTSKPATPSKPKDPVKPEEPKEPGKPVEPSIFTVKFINYDGSTLDTQKVEQGKAAKAPTVPSREGYTFAGWNAGFTNITKDIIVSSQWKINEYTVTFNTNGGSEIAGIKVEYGKTITKPFDPTKENYKFAGWFSDSGLTKSWDFKSKIEKDVTLYAKWDEIEVSAISVDPTELTLAITTSETLAVTFDPTNASNKTLTWKSIDEDVATVDASGKVTAIAKGTTTITATSNNGKTATTTVTVVAEDTVAMIGTTEYDTLKKAVAAVQYGDTVKLIANTTGDGIQVPSETNFTLDLGGFTYTVNGNLVGSTGTESQGFQLLKGSDITIKNGAITTTKAMMLIQNYSNLTLDNVELTGASMTQYVLSNNFGKTTLKNGTKITAADGQVAFDVYYGLSAAYDAGVSVTIADTNVVITGAYEYGKAGRVTDENWYAKAKLIIPEGYELAAPAGFKWVAQDGKQVLIDASTVAVIGAMQYNTLQEAVTAAESGQTIKLLADASGDGVIVPENSSFTLDLNGKTYTVDGTLVGSTGTETNGFQLLKGSTITIKNGTITTPNVTGAKILIQNYSNLTLDNVDLVGADVTQYVLSNNNGSTKLESGTTITAQDDNVAFDVYYWPGNGYESVTVEIASNDVDITGRVEYASDGGEGFATNAKLIIPADYELTAPAGYKWVAQDGKQVLIDASTVAMIDDVPYNSLQAAITAASSGHNTIKLYDNIDTEGLQLNGKNVAFDLNGKSLNTAKLEVNNSTVVFGDSSDNGEGTLATDDSYGVINAVNSNVTIENGRFVSSYNKAGSSGYANVIQVRNSELTINGGYFENTNNVGSYNYLIKAPSYSNTEQTTITINGGTFVSNRNYGYIVTGGSDANVNVVINGGAFTTTGRHSFLTNVKGSVVVNDCTFTATGNNTVFDIPKDSTVTVKGGTFSVNENSYMDPSLAGLIFHRKTNGWTNVNGTLLVDPVNPVKVNQQTYLGFLAEGATESAKDADGFYTITK